MLNRKTLRRIACLLVLVLLLGCFSGCKRGEDKAGGVVDVNGLAGDEIEIDIPDAPVKDGTDLPIKRPSTQQNKPQSGQQDAEQDIGQDPEQDGEQGEEPDDQQDQPQTKPQTKPQNKPQNNQQDITQDIMPDEEPSDEPSDEPVDEPTDVPMDEPDEEQDDENYFEEEENETPTVYDDSKALVVVSYNIKCAMYGKTFDQIVDQIKAVDADIVGFQEVDYLSNRSGNSIDQIKTLAEKAGFPYYKFEPVISLNNTKKKYPLDAKENLYGHAIMSKYPITKSEVVWPEAQRAGAEPRNFGRHEINVDGTKVVVYNGHLDGTEGRNQYFEIQEKWMKKDEYAICLGDFNETYAEFGPYFDFDNYYCFSFRDGSNVVMRGTEGNKKQVIDHIIVSKDKFLWKNGGEQDNGYYVTPHNGASDHNMVYCYLNIVK